jgi:hypothetical protein
MLITLCLYVPPQHRQDFAVVVLVALDSFFFCVKIFVDREPAFLC